MPHTEKREMQVACQQVLLPDASVYSVQWIDLPASVSARVTWSLLLEHYFRVIRNRTLGLVRPTVTTDGVRFRLLGTRLALLAFRPARFEVDQGGESVHLRICGGILVQAGECDRGMFSLAAAPCDQGVRVTVQLSDYCPLLLGSRTPSGLRRFLYGSTQSYIHKVVTVGYLSSLCLKLTGARPRAGVVKVQVRDGRDI
ncbi:MAG TPA: hypothetical protein DCZ75_12935 [Geobacter sp.]|nr:hypothetical protein [Geobacter sp.]